MSDDFEQDPEEAARLADRRAEKLSRAIETARSRRQLAGKGAQPTRPVRKAKLPPPPPVDPDDLRAMGLPVLSGGLGHSEPSAEVPVARAPVTKAPVTKAPVTKAPVTKLSPLILGTGATRALGPNEQTAPVAAPSADTPRKLFGGPPAATSQTTPTVAPPPEPAIPLLRLNGVRTDIARYRILQGVDLDVPKGQVTMLLGRNGVGKTTTLRTIMGLWRAREGDIWMDGRNLAAMQPAAIARAGIGYVPEDMGIFGDLTVEENMRLGALSGRLNRTRIDWLLRAFPALQTFWTKPAATLSGGQKQMLSIARTIVEPRRLYLIDEPTKGLAPAIISTLVAALRELKHEGATILMVEQNFAVARALGDTCAVMDDGRVVWSGAMATLAEEPHLQAELMGLHLEAGH